MEPHSDASRLFNVTHSPLVSPERYLAICRAINRSTGPPRHSSKRKNAVYVPL